MLVSLALAAVVAASDTSLVLHFDDLAPRGQVQVALFAGEAEWNGRARALRSATVQVSGQGAEVRFEALPPGTYGVMAYHDRNANGRLDTLPIGLPTEPYGFSNNARGTFGPPAWRAASFSLAPGEVKSLTIRLH